MHVVFQAFHNSEKGWLFNDIIALEEPFSLAKVLQDYFCFGIVVHDGSIYFHQRYIGKYQLIGDRLLLDKEGYKRIKSDCNDSFSAENSGLDYLIKESTIDEVTHSVNLRFVYFITEISNNLFKAALGV